MDKDQAFTNGINAIYDAFTVSAGVSPEIATPRVWEVGFDPVRETWQNSGILDYVVGLASQLRAGMEQDYLGELVGTGSVSSTVLCDFNESLSTKLGPALAPIVHLDTRLDDMLNGVSGSLEAINTRRLGLDDMKVEVMQSFGRSSYQIATNLNSMYGAMFKLYERMIQLYKDLHADGRPMEADEIGRAVEGVFREAVLVARIPRTTRTKALPKKIARGSVVLTPRNRTTAQILHMDNLMRLDPADYVNPEGL
jgi:hypothetical protein